MKFYQSNREKDIAYYLIVGICVVWNYIYFNGNSNIDSYLPLIILSLIFLVHIFFIQYSRLTTHFILFVLIYLLGKELLLGLLQLCNYIPSNHYLYAITGSFLNPGPYGGFLAVCISLFVAHIIKTKELIFSYSILLLFRWIALIIAIISFVILPSTQSRSAILALGCSMLLLIIGTESIRVKIKTILEKSGLWIALGLAVIGTGAYLYKKPSADGRFFMDKICIKAMRENGWKGAGIGHFGGAYGNAQASYFKKQIDEKGEDNLDWSAINEHDRITADCPDNAFNEYLFIGVEAGAIAMLLFIGIIISAIVISFKRGTIWCYGLTAFAVFALFSYPLHVKQFQMLFPILLSACVSDRRQNIQEQNDKSKELLAKGTRSILGIVSILVMLVVFSTFFLLNLPEVRFYKQAEKSWKKAERWYQKEYYEYVVEDCDTLLPYMKQNYRFLFAYGQSLNKTGHYEKSDSILKIGTELSSDPMFWNVMGNNSLALGKYREAEERYKHAFYMAPNRLYPLYLLSKLYDNEGDTTSFLRVCGKIETFIPKVESSNTAQLRKEIKEIRKGYLIDHNHMHREKGIKYSGSR